MYGCTSYAPPSEYAPERLQGLGKKSIQRSLNERRTTAAYSEPSGSSELRIFCSASSGVNFNSTDETSGAYRSWYRRSSVRPIIRFRSLKYRWNDGSERSMPSMRRVYTETGMLGPSSAASRCDVYFRVFA